MKRIFFNVISLLLLLTICLPAKSSIIEIKKCEQTNVRSIVDIPIKFLYKHPFVTFLAMWIYMEDPFKALIGAFIANGLAHEYLDIYNVSHGNCIGEVIRVREKLEKEEVTEPLRVFVH